MEVAARCGRPGVGAVPMSGNRARKLPLREVAPAWAPAHKRCSDPHAAALSCRPRVVAGDGPSLGLGSGRSARPPADGCCPHIWRPGADAAAPRGRPRVGVGPMAGARAPKRPLRSADSAWALAMGCRHFNIKLSKYETFYSPHETMPWVMIYSRVLNGVQILV